MKVRNLIDILQKCDPDDLVVLSKDEEGNGFSPLSSIDEMVYIPNWREVRYRKLTNSMILQGYSEEDVFDSSCGDPGQNAVVLWP